MPRVVTPQDERTLEDIVDRSSVYAVLCSLARICAAKAEHISDAWQDTRLARVWMRGSVRIDTFARNIGPFGPLSD